MELKSSEKLVELGLVSKAPKATEAFLTIWNQVEKNFKTPSFCVGEMWSVASSMGLDNNLRGSVFELIIGATLLQNDVQPLFRQAELTFVNNARFDFVLWDEGKYPIALSLKTSLRERYKQAVLESDAIKSVHRWAETYLITLDADAIRVRNSRKESKDEVTSLDGFILADSVDFDELIEHLKSKDLQRPILINPQRNNYYVGLPSARTSGDD